MRVTLKSILHGLAGRTVVLVMGSIFTFTAVLSLLLFFGTGRILDSWSDNEKASLDSFIKEKLSSLAQSAAKNGLQITAADTAKALEGLPYSPSWLVVTNPEGALLYFYRAEGIAGNGRNTGHMAAMRMQKMQKMKNMPMIRSMQDVQFWNEIRLADDSLVFRYSAYIPDFGEKESNRVLLGAARVILVWGFVIASIVSFLFALIFARPLKKQSARLVSALDRMAEGERDVSFPDCPVTEFDHIARASSILQDNLLHEEGLRRQWAADVAHDLRTPLTVLRGQFDGMIDGVFKPEPQRLARLEKEITRLENLINSLALLSHIESPGFAPARKKIELDPFLCGIAERFNEEARATGSSIAVEASGLSLIADPDLLERTIENLLTNALHYGVPGNAVFLQCIKNAISGKINIIVENDGLIDPEIIPRLFDRLFRADSSRNTEGSGLGLSIAQAIVNAHGGTIRAETDPEHKRTRFIIAI